MQWVFDASVAMAWCFEDEKTAATEALLDRLLVTPAAVPQLWSYEVGNVLALATRRGRITTAARSQFVAMLNVLPIQFDSISSQQALNATLALADAHGLTVYDASYLELAMRLGVPLASLDGDLRAAASAAGVALL
jgi:predicted nucleic acid-binding protein